MQAEVYEQTDLIREDFVLKYVYCHFYYQPTTAFT